MWVARVVCYIAGNAFCSFVSFCVVSNAFSIFCYPVLFCSVLPRRAFSPVTSPKANAMPFSPSRAWEVLAELVLSTTPSPTYSACSAAEGNCRGFFGSLEVESDAEGNHAAPRDDGVGWVGEGGHLRGGLHRSSGVSANGGSGTERFHAHRFVVALRSDPMRAMLHSGKSSA